MVEQWLNVIGLSLDFAGVVLLANEWRIAFKAEQNEAELAAREQMLKPSPLAPKPNNPHQPAFDHMREQLRFHQQRQRAQTARGVRRGWFLAALILVAVGFLLQILGSWPGRLWG